MALQAKRKYNVEDEWETNHVSKRSRALPDSTFKSDKVKSSDVRADVFMGYPNEYDSEDEAMWYAYDKEEEKEDLDSGIPDISSSHLHTTEWSSLEPTLTPEMVKEGDLTILDNGLIDLTNEGNIPNPSGHVCAVCSIPIHDTCRVVLFLGCGHFFHEICVDVDKVEKCLMCRDKLGPRYSKIQVMPFSIAMILLLLDSKARCDIVMNIIIEKQRLESMTAREFYSMLRKNVFGEKIPKVRNLYYKQRVLHREQFEFVGDEVDVFIQSGKCSGLCWQDQMCYIALKIYQTVDNSNIDHIIWLLTLFEDMYLYFGTMK
jgi:hypothetical protein